MGGNLYIYHVRSNTEAGENTGDIEGFQILDPRYMTPVVLKDGTVVGYVQNLRGNKVYFTDDEVSHLKYDNDIENEFLGMPALYSLHIDICLDEEAKESNLAYFRNDQVPGTVVRVKDDVTAEEAKEIKKKLKTEFSGGKNKHKSVVINGIEEIDRIQDKIDDAQFMDMRRFTLENVASLFGVPPSVLGYVKDVNLANGKEQRVEYIENTIRPDEELFAEFFTNMLQNEGYDVVFEFIDSHIDVIEAKAKTMVELVGAGILEPNEARAELGYDASDEENANSLWI